MNIHSINFFTANTQNFLKNSSQTVGHLVGRAVHFFQKFSSQIPYQRIGVMLTANVLFFCIIHDLSNFAIIASAPLRVKIKSDAKSYLMGDFVLSISQLAFNLLLSKAIGIKLNYLWLVAITTVTVTLRILIRFKARSQVKLALPNGEVYEGKLAYKKLKDDRYTGTAKLILPHQGVYEGDFIDGKCTGKGKYIRFLNKIYEGDFVEGKCSGKGQHTWLNGNFYKGDFVDGKRTGKGKFVFFGNKSVIYKGDFIDGKRTGKGKYIIHKGLQKYVYKGDFYKGDVSNGKWKYNHRPRILQEQVYVYKEVYVDFIDEPIFFIKNIII